MCKRIIVSVLTATLTLFGFAKQSNVFSIDLTDVKVPGITNLMFRQRYPWNGLVDIDVTVTGMRAGKIGGISCVASNLESQTELKMATVKYGDKSVDTNLEVTSDGTYRLVWDAKTDLKNGRFERAQIYAELKILDFDGHEGVQLWEGGPHWATCNVGANKPEEAGYYFWWGDTVGYKWEDKQWVASDGSVHGFTFSEDNTLTYNKENGTLKAEGWGDGYDCILLPAHDAATAHWGNKWRMPTVSEIYQLEENCTWTWMQRDGVNGYKVRGEGDYANAWIFIPVAGYGKGSALYNFGFFGGYWLPESSSPFSGNPIYSYYIYCTGCYYPSTIYRYYGLARASFQCNTGRFCLEWLAC